MHVGSRPVLVFERLLPGSRMSCRDAGRPSAALHSVVNAAGPSTTRWQLSANHHHLSRAEASAYHLVGAGEQHWRNFDAQPLGGLQIDDQFEFRRQRDWQVGWLLALENPPGVDANLSIRVREAPTIAHQTAGRDELTQRVNSRQRIARRRRN